MTLVGATGWTSSVASARVCLALPKAVMVSSVHGGESEGRFMRLKRECSEWVTDHGIMWNKPMVEVHQPKKSP